MPQLSELILETDDSPLRSFADEIAAAKSDGVALHRFDIGNPDIPTSLTDADISVKLTNERYGPGAGLLELRVLVAEQYDSTITAEDVIITPGSSQALLNLFIATALGKENKSIVTPSPAYTNYIQLASQLGIDVIALPRFFEDGFALPEEDKIHDQFSQHLGKLAALLITTPSNPDGTVYSRAELDMLGRIAEDFDLWLLVDSAYNRIHHDNYTTPFDIDVDPERVVDIISFSKTYNIPGDRVGGVVTLNKALLENLTKQMNALLGTSVLDQKAAIKAMKVTTPEDLAAAQVEYRRREQEAITTLDRFSDEGIRYVKPAGSFYMVVKVDDVNTENLLRYMLTPEFYNQTGKRSSTFVPMQRFYPKSVQPAGLNELRLALVNPRIQEGIELIAEGVRAYKKHNSQHSHAA